MTPNETVTPKRSKQTRTMLRKGSMQERETCERRAWVLLEQKRRNNLSSWYEKEPYKVMTWYGDQVVLRSSNGGEYRTNMHHIKAFNIPVHERAASQSKRGSASASATQATAPKPGTPVVYVVTSSHSQSESSI